MFIKWLAVCDCRRCLWAQWKKHATYDAVWRHRLTTALPGNWPTAAEGRRDWTRLECCAKMTQRREIAFIPAGRSARRRTQTLDRPTTRTPPCSSKTSAWSSNSDTTTNRVTSSRVTSLPVFRNYLLLLSFRAKTSRLGMYSRLKWYEVVTVSATPYWNRHSVVTGEQQVRTYRVK